MLDSNPTEVNDAVRVDGAARGERPTVRARLVIDLDGRERLPAVVRRGDEELLRDAVAHVDIGIANREAHLVGRPVLDLPVDCDRCGERLASILGALRYGIFALE